MRPGHEIVDLDQRCVAPGSKPCGKCALARSARTVDPDEFDSTLRRVRPQDVRENVIQIKYRHESNGGGTLEAGRVLVSSCGTGAGLARRRLVDVLPRLGSGAGLPPQVVASSIGRRPRTTQPQCGSQSHAPSPVTAAAPIAAIKPTFSLGLRRDAVGRA